MQTQLRKRLLQVVRKGQAYAKVVSISTHRLDDMYVFTCGGITVTYGGLSYVNVVMGLYTEGSIFNVASALYAYSKTAVKPQGFL